VTGLQVLQTDLAPKRLQILKELIPRLQRVALLHETPGSHAGDPFYAQLLATLDTAGKTLGVQVRRFAVPTEDELDRVFADMKRDSEAAIVVANPFMTVPLPRLVELAVRHHLPTMNDLRSYVEAGGLVSYGAKLPELFRRAAYYVDRILK